jgi:hypothetical protein
MSSRRNGRPILPGKLLGRMNGGWPMPKARNWRSDSPDSTDCRY